MRQDIYQRFMSKVSPEPMSGCWLWTGAVNRIGYGMFHLKHDKKTNKSYAALAHRFSFEFHTGKDLGELYALHKCDNPACVNPDHIYAGTQADNVADMDAKGRRINRPLCGSKHSNSKLKEDDILHIKTLRNMGLKQKEIGNIFGVSQVQIGNILRGKQWNHLQEQAQ
jgi:predicted XRE-type DNA-binding protein